jgi:hypothetical protein
LVPERYRWVDLRKLTPSEGVKMPVELQQKYIYLLRDRPDFSYLLIGDGGTGKTTLSTALYRHALKQWACKAYSDSNVTPPVWRVTANQLVDEFHALSIGWQAALVDAYGNVTMECTVDLIVTIGRSGPPSPPSTSPACSWRSSIQPVQLQGQRRLRSSEPDL